MCIEAPDPVESDNYGDLDNSTVTTKPYLSLYNVFNPKRLLDKIWLLRDLT